MLLLLHALIPCLAADIYCPHPLSCCIYTALVSLLFGTVIPTSLNILMEMFLLSCFTGFSLYRNSRMPYYVSIKAYTAPFKSSALFNMLRLYGRVHAIPT